VGLIPEGSNLLRIPHFKHPWKHSKKDFFVMFTTITVVFLFDTGIGLAIGISLSVIVYLVFDNIFAKSHHPRLFSSHRNGYNVEVVRIESDLNFLTAARIKDFITALAVPAQSTPDASNTSEHLRFKISHAFDTVLQPNLLVGVESLPSAIVIDLCRVKTVDISGLQALQESLKEVRDRGVLAAVINPSPYIQPILIKFGIKSDLSTEEIKFEEYEEAYRLELWIEQDIFILHP
jgi:MFS superfamily sulfate permease-like transporter